MSRLTPAERRALEAYARHRSAKDAAAELGKSPRTLEHQLRRARERLGVPTSWDAVKLIDDAAV